MTWLHRQGLYSMQSALHSNSLRINQSARATKYIHPEMAYSSPQPYPPPSTSGVLEKRPPLVLLGNPQILGIRIWLCTTPCCMSSRDVNSVPKESRTNAYVQVCLVLNKLGLFHTPAWLSWSEAIHLMFYSDNV